MSNNKYLSFRRNGKRWSHWVQWSARSHGIHRSNWSNRQVFLAQNSKNLFTSQHVKTTN